METTARDDALRAAIEAGRASARAASAHRLLDRELAHIGRDLGGAPIDATMVASVAQVGVHCAGWLGPAALHVLNRASLWTFVADWLVDQRAGSPDDVDAFIARGVAASQGRAEPGDGAAALLAGVRADLAGSPLLGAWSDEIRRYFDATRREFLWRTGPKPTVEEYLSNLDSVGLRIAVVTLLAVDGAGPDDWRPGAGSLTEATDATALVIRLANDLAGAAREQRFGDVNLLSLGVEPTEVRRQISWETARCRRLYALAPPAHQRHVGYLERVLGFNLGVYDAGDYWGGDIGG